jgi:hypothetical protein
MIGSKVVIYHLKDNKGNYIKETGTIVDVMSEPLERIKVKFEGDRYPKPLWISHRLLRGNDDTTI